MFNPIHPNIWGSPKQILEVTQNKHVVVNKKYLGFTKTLRGALPIATTPGSHLFQACGQCCAGFYSLPPTSKTHNMVLYCFFSMATKRVGYVDFRTILGQQPGEQKHAVIKCTSPFCKGICPFGRDICPFAKVVLVTRFHCSMAIHLWVPTA